MLNSFALECATPTSSSPRRDQTQYELAFSFNVSNVERTGFDAFARNSLSSVGGGAGASSSSSTS